jgi:lysyl-tRNA synthetase class II
MAAKALRPLRAAHKQLAEVTRVRQRYLDLIVRDAATVLGRADAVRSIRELLHSLDFIKVETPRLPEDGPADPYAVPDRGPAMCADDNGQTRRGQ